ncbi:MAG: hypothetical protein ACYC0X_06645 [Pirellulaceae bacterium]
MAKPRTQPWPFGSASILFGTKFANHISHGFGTTLAHRVPFAHSRLLLLLVLVIVTRNRFPFRQPRLFPLPFAHSRLLLVLVLVLVIVTRNRFLFRQPRLFPLPFAHSHTNTRRLRTMLEYDYEHEHEVDEAKIGDDANTTRDG